MSEDDRRRVRDAFERAAGGEPAVGRLLDAVPALQERARTRRAAALPGRRGARLIPTLAAATATLVAVALVLTYSDRTTARNPAPTLDSLILSGVGTGEDDALLDAVLSTERTDG
jgi:hypothetical protein